MVEKKKTRKEKTTERVKKIVAENASEKALEILGLMLRARASAKSLADAYINAIKPEIRKLMDSLEIKEHIVRRTIIKKVYVYKFPDDKEKARRAYEELVSSYGQENVDKWIEVGTQDIPATTKTTYKIREAGIEDIEERGLEAEFSKKINSTPRISAEQIPARAKKGKPLERRKKKEK